MLQRTAVRKQVKAMVAQQHRLEVSTYDRAASWLVALLVSLGVAVLMLFVVWLTDRIQHDRAAVPVDLLPDYAENGQMGGNGQPAGGSQLDVPSDEPFLGSDPSTSELASNLSEMGAAIAGNAVELDDPLLAVPPKRQGSFGTGGGTGGGNGDGTGIDIGPGPHGRPRNWEIVFKKGETAETYVKQLDAFGIELGVLRGGKIYYAKNFRKHKPDTRVESDPSRKEQRYWLRWTQGDLRKIDVELLERAVSDPGEGFILKFLPPALEAELARLESLKAGGDIKRVRKTRFGVQQTGDKYQFYVMEQLYKW